MRFMGLTLLLLTGLVPGVSAEVFRCSDASGVRFSDTPCGDNAETIILEDNRIGGNFGTNLPKPAPAPDSAEDSGKDEEPEAAAPAGPESPCRYIASTDLRRYILREQVVKGMTRQNVIDAFGRTPETYPVPQETWVYSTDYYGRLYELTYVYFRDGCVEKVVYRKP